MAATSAVSFKTLGLLNATVAPPSQGATTTITDPSATTADDHGDHGGA